MPCGNRDTITRAISHKNFDVLAVSLTVVYEHIIPNDIPGN